MDLALLGKAMGDNQNDRNRVAAATAAVAGVTVVDFLTGQQTSRHEGSGSEPRTNGSRMAQQNRQQSSGVHVTQSLTINRPAEELYRFWHDFQNLPRFMSHLESVQVRDNAARTGRPRRRPGRRSSGTPRSSKDRPERADRLALARQAPTSTTPARCASRRRRAAGARRCTSSCEYNPPGGALGALVAKLFGEEPEQQVCDDLRRFKQVMETGEVVRSDGELEAPRLRSVRRSPREPDASADRRHAASAATSDAIGYARHRIEERDDESELLDGQAQGPGRDGARSRRS